MMPESKRIKVLVIRVNKLTGEIKELHKSLDAFVDCIIDLHNTIVKQNDILNDQNEWLKELSEILTDDEEYDREREEWKDHVNPINRREHDAED